jgi:hypothetical protein
LDFDLLPRGERDTADRLACEDLPMHFLHFPGGFDSEFRHEPMTAFLERPESLGLSAGHEQREHQERREVLTQRVLPQQPSQLRDGLGVPAEHYVDGYTIFRDGSSLLSEPFALGREVRTWKVSERLPAPEAECNVESGTGSGEVDVDKGCSLRRRTGEEIEVDLLPVDVEDISIVAERQEIAGPGYLRPRLQSTAQAADVLVHQIAGVARQFFPPDRQDDLRGSARLSCRQEQPRQDRTLTCRAEVDLPVVPPGSDRAKKRESKGVTALVRSEHVDGHILCRRRRLPKTAEVFVLSPVSVGFHLSGPVLRED